MFRVTPVMEDQGARGRRVSFSPDVDDSYRMNVIDKIKGLMDEVEKIHIGEERQLSKAQDAEKWAFKQKQEKAMQDFLKKQKMEEQSFEQRQVDKWNNLKEKHTQETLTLFGASSRAWNQSTNSWSSGNERKSVQNVFWNQQPGWSRQNSSSNS